MKEVSLHDARDDLSALIAKVEATGESIFITRHGRPVARLSPVSANDRSERRTDIARSLLERLEEQRIRNVGRPPGPSWEESKAGMDEDRA